MRYGLFGATIGIVVALVPAVLAAETSMEEVFGQSRDIQFHALDEDHWEAETEGGKVILNPLSGQYRVEHHDHIERRLVEERYLGRFCPTDRDEKDCWHRTTEVRASCDLGAYRFEDQRAPDGADSTWRGRDLGCENPEVTIVSELCSGCNPHYDPTPTYSGGGDDDSSTVGVDLDGDGDLDEGLSNENYNEGDIGSTDNDSDIDDDGFDP